MAITRVYQSGFETGSLGEITSHHPSVIVSNSYAKTGTYSLRVSHNNSYDQWATIGIPGTRQCRFGAWVYPNFTSAGYVDLIKLRNGSGTALVELELAGSVVSNTMVLKINGALQDSYPNSCESEEWVHIGVDTYIHSTSGSAAVFIDGIEVMRFDGNTGNTDIVDMIISTWSGVAGHNYYYYDDIYIDDTTGELATTPPMLRFEWLSPNGNGNYSQWTPSSGSGYECIDEVPPSDSDYIQSDAVGEKESHNMSTYTLGSAEECKAIIPIVRASKAGTGEALSLGTRLSSVDNLGSAQGLPASAGYLWERQETKPGGGSWGQSDIDGFEVLLESSGSF